MSNNASSSSLQAQATGTARSGSLLLMLGVVLIASNLRASITVVGPLTSTIRAETGLSNVLASLLTAFPLLAFALLSPLAPGIARRIGTEKTLFASLIALTLGILLRSVPGVAPLFIGTAVMGAGIAVGNVLLPSLIKRDFPGKVGLLTGLYSMSMSTWAALASGISVPISSGLGLGWRGSLGCWAVLSIAGLIVWLPQLRSTQSKSTAAAAQSASISLWRSRLAWQVTLFMGLQSLAFYVTIAWLPAILHDRGMSPTTAGWMLSLMQAVSLPFSFIMPTLAGRRASQRGLVAFSACSALLGYVGLLLTSSPSIAPLWIVLIGIGQGGSISLALAFFALRSATPAQAAVLSGMAQSLGYLLAAVGPILIGWLHDLTGAWSAPLLVLIIATALYLMCGIGAGRNIQIGSSAKR
ncbi:CynX/NimT family MFS transporter [Paenibacillus sp. OAS669]|uniref:CynX/NimT family MFS transporter n=1 Tax=Paenibacillus sp. OAS669 TaxID=2663821 RepID=UPI00178A092F|nr:MFS transporter [Paenibacillus sp. OAS669]MBE1443374.1 CP family cyanate transporter-like MFS transporter [Paenibacillus sp. OAS669]